MKKILLILALSASFCGAITNGVYATKDPYVIEAARMDYPRWLDSLLWLTAESPVLNAGATNANWICYAKTCTGDAYQTGTGYQPTSIVTNGIKALYFDGTDDFLLYPTSPRFSGTNSFTLTMWLDLNGYWPAGSGNAYLGGVYETATTNRSWAMQMRGPTIVPQTDVLTLLTSSDGAAVSQTSTAQVPKSAVTNGWTHVALIRTGSAFQYVINGTPYASQSANIYSSPAPLSIGAIASGGGAAGMLLADIKFHGSALATNVVTDIFNAEKARYGK
jgi:hypothetical protein